MNELLDPDYHFSMRQAVPLFREAPHILKTHLVGMKTIRPWPLSASFLLPIIEQVGNASTPSSLLPVVAHFYNYIRYTDDYFDNNDHFPDRNETKEAVLPHEKRLFESINGAFIQEQDREYIVELFAHLEEVAYNALTLQHSWKNSPAFDKAYQYRQNTTGILSDVVAKLWCMSTGVLGAAEENIISIVRTVGMLFQYYDDFRDVYEDNDTDGNLVRAIVHEEGETALLSIEATHQQKALLATMVSSAPKSLERLLWHMNAEYEILQDISPNIHTFLHSFMLASFPYIKV